MSAEERWAERQEWAQERGEVEIKSEEDLQPGDSVCYLARCDEGAVKAFVVGEVGKIYSNQEIKMCRDHSDPETVFEFYEDHRE